MINAMQERQCLQRRFVERFAVPFRGKLNDPLSSGELLAVETQLAARLPASIRQFMLSFGDVLTSVEDAWFNANAVDCPVALQSIFGHSMPRMNTPEWLAPIPAAISGDRSIPSAKIFDFLVTFADDALGNLFCIPRQNCNAGNDDAPVLFFDHDLGEIRQIASSFDELLCRYLDL